MRRRAVARGRVVELARVLLRVCDQLAQARHADARMHRHDERRGAHLGHRHEVAARLEAGARADDGVDEDARGARDQHRVAVGRAAGDLLGGDARAGAGLVLDHERLAKRAHERLLQRARDEIGRAARREADHQLDRMRGIALRKTGARKNRQNEEENRSHELQRVAAEATRWLDRTRRSTALRSSERVSWSWAPALICWTASVVNSASRRSDIASAVAWRGWSPDQM